MKYWLLSLCLTMGVVLQACHKLPSSSGDAKKNSTSALLMGKWSGQKIELQQTINGQKQEANILPFESAWVLWKADNTFEAQNTDGTHTKGTWKLSDDQTKIRLEYENRTADELEIVSLTKQNAIFRSSHLIKEEQVEYITQITSYYQR